MPFNRHRQRGGRFPFFMVFTVLKAFVLGGLVMLLWNFVMPSITGIRLISYWQAVALWLLCRLLFSGIGYGNGPNRSSSPWRGAWKDKWLKMTPEDREKFQQEWRNRWKRKE